LIFIYLFEFFAWFRSYPHLIWTNVPSWFLISPLLYLQIRKTIFPMEKAGGLSFFLHFLPTFGIILFLSPFYFQLSGPEKVKVFEGFYGQGYQVDYVQMLYGSQILIYAYLGLRLIFSQNMRQQAGRPLWARLQLFQHLYWALLAYVLSAVILLLMLLWAYEVFLPLYYFVFLALAFTIIGTSIHLLPFPNRVFIGPGLDRSDLFIGPKDLPRYKNSSLGPMERKKLLVQLQETMLQKALYRQKDLKLADLAQLSEIKVHHLSQILNQELDQNFFEFVNHYRVRAVKNALANGQAEQMTLWAIAEQCGFKSESSFYRVFKRLTGLTPRSYLDQVKP
ncbi:MAG: helix-turn-helix transcriptional regulator, partial [Bacteroidota bacterium]